MNLLTLAFIPFAIADEFSNGRDFNGMSLGHSSRNLPEFKTSPRLEQDMEPNNIDNNNVHVPVRMRNLEVDYWCKVDQTALDGVVQGMFDIAFESIETNACVVEESHATCDFTESSSFDDAKVTCEKSFGQIANFDIYIDCQDSKGTNYDFMSAPLCVSRSCHALNSQSHFSFNYFCLDIICIVDSNKSFIQ